MYIKGTLVGTVDVLLYTNQFVGKMVKLTQMFAWPTVTKFNQNVKDFALVLNHVCVQEFTNLFVERMAKLMMVVMLDVPELKPPVMENVHVQKHVLVH